MNQQKYEYERAKHLWENKESLEKYLARLKELMGKDEQIPRRIRMDLWLPAELAIHNAMQEVEKMPASVTLTNAVIMLGKAKDLVSDFIDESKLHSPSKPEEPSQQPGIRWTDEKVEEFAMGFVEWYIDLAENKSKYLAFKFKYGGFLKGSDFISEYKKSLSTEQKEQI